MKLKLSFSLVLVLFFSEILVAESSKILISEFMAINSETLQDGDGDFPDWIELFNNTDSEIDLNGWYLTDDSSNLKKWQFPSVSLQKGAYLIVFMSDKDTTDSAGYLHANFKLSGSGEYLAICEPDANISFSYSPSFPAQRKDISYGIYQGQYVYFDEPTPGAENVRGNLPFAPNFSKTRGFYETAFDVALSTPGSEGSIYYTLDGTRPSKTTGTLYSSPINISKTTPLSAVSINDSDESSEIITHTYWFLDDILEQPAAPDGYPTDWKKAGSSTSIPADYEMDQDICNASEYKDVMEQALTMIPSMDIVTSKHYLFSDVEDETNGGIYIYTGKPSAKGLDWVRPTSVEYYDPNTGKEFQINCRLKLHGGNSRNPGNSAKHGFELAFVSSYGPSKLNFEVFDEKKTAKVFNSLVLRAGYNYSWVKNNETQRKDTQYLNDPWTKNTQLAMGKTSGHERFVHLYINGLYWGLYNLAEKYTNDFLESYMKGEEEDFDIVKEKHVVTSGNINAFNALLSQMKSSLSNNANYQKIQGRNSDGSINPSYLNLLDMDNYIDYMLVNYYIGNGDWNKNNWVMVRNRVSNEAGFRFLCWDAETTLTDVEKNLVEENGDDGNPMAFIRYLIGNNDFKILLADRIQKHMIDAGGALTPAEASERYFQLADEIDLPIIGESARWGDYRKDIGETENVYTRNDYWVPRKQDLLDNYFPFRTDIVIEQLRDKGYFPNITAPVFTDYGGEMTSAIDLGMTSNYGEIYYTTDGTDPREQITSEISSQAQIFINDIHLTSNVTIKARAKSGSEWSPITVGVFDFENVTALDDLVSTNNIEFGNYPNPFKESTQIWFKLPSDGNIQIDVYSIDGRLVKNLYEGHMKQGLNKIMWSPDSKERGIFIYKLNFENKDYFGKVIHN